MERHIHCTWRPDEIRTWTLDAAGQSCAAAPAPTFCL